MTHPHTHRVAVLVATAYRPSLLAGRALPSIEGQTRTPWRVVVVDDARNDADARRTERAVRAWQPAGIVVDFLRKPPLQGSRRCLELGPRSLAAHRRRSPATPCRAPGRRRSVGAGPPGALSGARREPSSRHDRGSVPSNRGGRRASAGNSAPVAPGIELPGGQSRHPGQQPGLPSQRAARSGPVRRVAAELHGPRSLHPRLGPARCALRRHRPSDRSSFRVLVAAPVVHAALTRPAGRTRRLLSQALQPHVRSRA